MADELILSIEKLVYGGDGLAHADGNTVFVPYVIPGEEVRADIKQKRNKLIWGRCWRLRYPRRSVRRRFAPTFKLAAVAITSTFLRRNNCG